MSDVTQILSEIEHGDPAAAERLWPVVYDELRKLAATKLAREKPGQTLDADRARPRSLSATRRSSGGESQRWNGRGHFFAAAAEAMRRIMVENARRKARIRHGGELERVEMDVASLAVQTPDDDVVAVHEALDALEKSDAEAAQLVKLHYFLGLSIDETAQLMGLSTRTAYRTWSYAKAWLYQHIGR